MTLIPSYVVSAGPKSSSIKSATSHSLLHLQKDFDVCCCVEFMDWMGMDVVQGDLVSGKFKISFAVLSKCGPFCAKWV